MSDLAEAVTTAAIKSAAAELGELIEAVKAPHNLEDDALDLLRRLGDVLLSHIAGHRALSVEDILLKFELWRRLPADFWDTGSLIVSVVTDLEEFTQQCRFRDLSAHRLM